MILVKVGDDLTTDLSYEESIGLIKAAGLPVTMSFKKMHGITSAKGLAAVPRPGPHTCAPTHGLGQPCCSNVAAMAALRTLLCFHYRRFGGAPSLCSGGGEGIQVAVKGSSGGGEGIQLWPPGI